MRSARTRCRVVVVGAGVMGCATAWWLARQGHDVTLVEQFGPDHEHGSSHGCSRIFRLAYSDPGYARSARAALGLWRRLEEEAQVQLLHTTGGVDHGVAEATALVARGMVAAGVRFAELSAAAAAQRWPGLRFESAVLYQPDTGRLDADAAMHTLRRGAAEHGTTVRFDTPVTDIRARGGRAEVVLADSVVPADVAVVTTGAWLPAALPRLSDRFPGLRDLPAFKVTQEQPVYLPIRDDAVEWPVFLHHQAVTGGASNSGFGYYGIRTPERGIKVGEHATGPEVDPAGQRPGPAAEATARVVAYARRWLPGAADAAATVETCLYTSTPDGEFVLRRDGPVIVCSACSGHGFKFAPLIGKRAAALAVA